jgi:uncharacterized membrane protein
VAWVRRNRHAHDRRLDSLGPFGKRCYGFAVRSNRRCSRSAAGHWLRFGLAVLPVGLSHLVYIPEAVGFVPAWLPDRKFWACLTGAGQIACGLGILFRVFPRVAAWCEASMVSLFTLLVWLPIVISKPRDRGAWTGFFISWIIGSAAWVVAQQLETDIAHERAERRVRQMMMAPSANQGRPPLRE